ncbi:unnamed protein product [Chrysoparadoxa australica]
MLVCKVYTGDSCWLEQGTAAAGLQEHLQQASASGCKSCIVGGPGARQEWYFLDGALVLPEYLVEFDLVLEPTPDHQRRNQALKHCMATWQQELVPAHPSSGKGFVEIVPFLLALARLAQAVEEQVRRYHVLLESSVQQALAMKPYKSLPAEPSILQQTTMSEMLVRRCGVLQVSSIVYLDLHGK